MLRSGTRPIPATLFALALGFLPTLAFSQAPPATEYSPAEMQVRAARARIEAAENEMLALVQRKEAVSAQFNVLLRQRETLMEEQDDAGVSEESFSEIMKTLQSQRVQLMIDLAGLEARRNALENARLEDNARNNEGDMLLPLERLLEIQEQNLERLRELFMQGVVSPDDVNAAEQRMLEAKIQLAQAKGPSATPVNDLTGQLLQVSLERADKAARLDKTERILETIASSRNLVARADNIEREISLMQAEIVAIDASIRQSRDEMDMREHQLEMFEEMMMRDARERDRRAAAMQDAANRAAQEAAAAEESATEAAAADEGAGEMTERAVDPSSDSPEEEAPEGEDPEQEGAGDEGDSSDASDAAETDETTTDEGDEEAVDEATVEEEMTEEAESNDEDAESTTDEEQSDETTESEESGNESGEGSGEGS